MSEQRPPGSGDDFHVEVSDASARGHNSAAHRNGLADPPASVSISPFAPRLTRRARALRVGSIVGALLLVLAVVLGSFPATRIGATRLLAGLRPTPTATLVPGSDAFYLLPNPPGTTVLLDGRVLTNPPLPGDPQPLVLARGAHTFVWRNTRFPFQPLGCRLSAPPNSHDTCTLIQPYQVNTGGEPLPAPIIAERLTLAALPSAEAAALTTVIQAALGGMAATATIAPGDHYLAVNGAVRVATDPLTAVFQVRPIADPLSEPCLNGPPGGACRFPGQTCEALCTLPNPGVRGAGPPARWIAGTPVQLVWSYVASDSTTVQSNVQASGYGIETALLGVSWDGTSWQAQPLLGQHSAIPTSDDLVCDAAWQPFYQSPQVSYLFYPDASTAVTTEYAAGSQVSDGCVVRITNLGQTTAPLIPGDGTALFLEHCGAVLAASDAAHILWPDLPQADTAERLDAQRLAAALPNP